MKLVQKDWIDIRAISQGWTEPQEGVAERHPKVHGAHSHTMIQMHLYLFEKICIKYVICIKNEGDPTK